MWEALREPFRYPGPRVKDADPDASPADRRAKAKAKDWQGTLRRIWHYLSRRRGRLSLVMLLVIVSCGLTLLGPYLIGMAIDDYLEGPGGRPWLLFLLGLTCVYVLQSIVGWLQNIWMIQIAQETVLRMRTDLFAQLHRLPIPFFGRNRQGDLMSRMTNDIDSVSSTLNSSAIQLLSSVLMLAGTVVVMLLLSPLLTLLTFVVVPLMALGMRWITRRTGALFRERQRNLGELNGFVEETLSGQRIIKAFSQEERVIQAFHERNVRIKHSGFWAQTISGFIPKLMNGLNNLSFAIIACVGGILAIRGAITVGVIIVFVEYARQFTRPLNDLANQWNTLLSAIAGAERVFEVLDEQEEDADERAALTLDAVQGAVVFHKVSFAYEEGRNTLKEISFKAKPGETIAIIGPTGAGKTSLIQLLSRFYDTSEGTITLDGRDIRTIRRESLRSHMAFVLQDSFLFEGTIRDNIRYGKLDATDSQVEEAAKLANAHSFIMRLSGGYDRVLIADGSGISQGQRQLIAIARAILKDPAILVLDEATSSIDTVSEIKIQEGLKRLMEGRTSFVIAHRLNTIREADRILVLKEGCLVEQGPHEELLGKQGLYSDLYHGQSEHRSAVKQ